MGPFLALEGAEEAGSRANRVHSTNSARAEEGEVEVVEAGAEAEVEAAIITIITTTITTTSTTITIIPS